MRHLNYFGLSANNYKSMSPYVHSLGLYSSEERHERKERSNIKTQKKKFLHNSSGD